MAHKTPFVDPTYRQISCKAPSFKILEKISSSKFSVFLISLEETQDLMALKLFPYEDNQPNKSFTNESAFLGLSHENIISFKYIEPCQKVKHKDKSSLASYIIMELAPYGCFTTLLKETNLFKNEKLVRTYFHQLIDGIEYLHSKSVAHLDLKIDNLLLGAGFKLKIADFDCSYKPGDENVSGRGTKNYRAPELRERSCTDPFAADIYAAGVILFVLLTGCFPYVEGVVIDGINLEELLRTDAEQFWRAHEEFLPNPDVLTEDFKSLFMAMVREDAVERATILEIKQSKWYQGDVYRPKEYRKIVSNKLGLSEH